MFFDIGAGEIIGLAILGLILVGPERLPKLASDAAALVRHIQRISQTATKEFARTLDLVLKIFNLRIYIPKLF